MRDNDREGNFIETYTGNRFFPFDPRPEEVRLADIAAGLAHVCRFGGHCRHFYSVALHSLHVSSELSVRGPRLELYGLLHDAGEAYLGDIPRPIKAEFDGIERAEDRVLTAVWDGLDVPPPTDEEWTAVMEADDRLLAYEADNLLADGSWAADQPDLDYALRVDSVSSVRQRFSARAEDLLGNVRAEPTSADATR